MADEEGALFESALNDAPDVAQPEPVQDTPEVVRDEKGRFASKQPEPEPVAEAPVMEAQTEPEPKERDQGIPPWRLREEAEARRAAEERASQHERQLAEMRTQLAQLQQSKQPPTPAPNVFEDPDGYTNYVQQQQASQLNQTRLETRFEISETLIRDKMGDAKFEELKQWAHGRASDPAFEAKLLASRHPWGEAAKLFQQEQVLTQVGSDPNAWFEKQLEERMSKDPAFQTKLMERIRGTVQQQRPAPITQLPPSLNKATAAAPMDSDGEDLSDAGLLKTALRR